MDALRLRRVACRVGVCTLYVAHHYLYKNGFYKVGAAAAASAWPRPPSTSWSLGARRLARGFALWLHLFYYPHSILDGVSRSSFLVVSLVAGLFV